MQLIHLDKIKPIVEDKQAVLEAVKQGFIQHAQGQITLPEPVQILFGTSEERLAGDCHIKTASNNNLPYFCIKVATGFYKTPKEACRSIMALLYSCPRKQVSPWRFSKMMGF